MFTIYGALGSGSVPIEAAMSLIGLSYTVVEAPTWEGEAEQAKVAGVNPLRQIPALVTPDGETITESAAILLWLADRHPEARLAPSLDSPLRGQFLRWMVFVPASIYSLFWVRDDPSRLGGPEPGSGHEVGPPRLHVMHRAGTSGRRDEIARRLRASGDRRRRVVGVDGSVGHGASVVGAQPGHHRALGREVVQVARRAHLRRIDAGREQPLLAGDQLAGPG